MTIYGIKIRLLLQKMHFYFNLVDITPFIFLLTHIVIWFDTHVIRIHSDIILVYDWHAVLKKALETTEGTIMNEQTFSVMYILLFILTNYKTIWHAPFILLGLLSKYAQQRPVKYKRAFKASETKRKDTKHRIIQRITDTESVKL